MSASTGTNFIRVAEKFADTKFANFTNLTPSALYELAAPSTDDVREEIEEAVEAGDAKSAKFADLSPSALSEPPRLYRTSYLRTVKTFASFDGMNLISSAMKAIDPDRVIERRLSLGLSLPDLGRLCGVSYQAIQQVEKGKTARPRFLHVLARSLHTSPEYLLGDSDIPESSLVADMNSTTADGIEAMRLRLIERICKMSDEKVAALAVFLDEDSGG